MRSDISDDVFVEYLCWMVTRDKGFLALYVDVLLPETFRSAEIGYLISKARDFYLEHNDTLPIEAYVMMLQDRPEQGRFNKELALKLYEDAPQPEGILRDYIFDHAKDWFKRRALYAAMDHAQDALEKGEVESAREILTTATLDVATVGDDSHGIAAVAEVEKFLELFQKNYVEDSNAIPIHMPSLDKLMRGGLRPGELGVWMAGPNGGKSMALAWNARHGMLDGYKTMCVSLEMNYELYLQRVWAGIIDRSTDEMELDFEGTAKLIRYEADKLSRTTGELIVKQYPAKQATVATLAAHIAMLERVHGWRPDELIVDYGDLLAAGRHYDVRRDEVATIYEDLRALGQIAGIPVWTATQANREGVRKGVLSMQHISDSWDKAKVADYIFALNQNDVQRELGEMDIIPVKVRNNARGGFVPFTVDFSRANFNDLGNETHVR